ncbi:SOS response-associated peptidase [SAR202 cluster bacterium AD-804-J14_MRT_500m]|nr:SOS response-associated peptidase [SAR202 cluster bacterium AD-804-J14_MRT_500m]
MCGRYALHSEINVLQQRFNFDAAGLNHSPHYNIAPSQQVLTVTSDGKRRAQSMRWGLIPFWAKEEKSGYRMINARSETLGQRPAFRSSIRSQRCLILADGFFEWSRKGTKRNPMYIYMRSSQPFAFAGLWSPWTSPEGTVIESCTIITTDANEVISPIHDRMPVILSSESESLWIDPYTNNLSELSHLLKAAPTDLMELYPVSEMVNSPRNDTPEVLARITLA